MTTAQLYVPQSSVPAWNLDPFRDLRQRISDTLHDHRFIAGLKNVGTKIHEAGERVIDSPMIRYLGDTIPRFGRETGHVFDSFYMISAAMHQEEPLGAKIYDAMTFTLGEIGYRIATASDTTKIIWTLGARGFSSLKGCTPTPNESEYRFEIGDKVQIIGGHVDPYPHAIGQDPSDYQVSRVVSNQICDVVSRSPGFLGEDEPRWYGLDNCTSNSGLSHAVSGYVPESSLMLHVEPTAMPIVVPESTPIPLQGCYLTDSSGYNDGTLYPIGKIDPANPNSSTCLEGNRWEVSINGIKEIIPGGTPP